MTLTLTKLCLPAHFGVLKSAKSPTSVNNEKGRALQCAFVCGLVARPIADLTHLDPFCQEGGLGAVLVGAIDNEADGWSQVALDPSQVTTISSRFWM